MLRRSLGWHFFREEFSTGEILKFIWWWYSMNSMIFLHPFTCPTHGEYHLASWSLPVFWKPVCFEWYSPLVMQAWLHCEYDFLQWEAWLFVMQAWFYWANDFPQLNEITLPHPRSRPRYSSRYAGQPQIPRWMQSLRLDLRWLAFHLNSQYIFAECLLCPRLCAGY